MRLAVIILVAAGLFAFQRFRGPAGSGRVNEACEWEMQDPVDDSPDAREKGEYVTAGLAGIAGVVGERIQTKPGFNFCRVSAA